MDPRRFLMIAAAGLLLSGCAILRPQAAAIVEPPSPSTAGLPAVDPVLPPPVDDPAVPYLALAGEADPAPVPAAVEDIPHADHQVGAVRVFAWTAGRVYPVRAAPLRVTTLTLPPGETLVAKAAGDTVRWQIGEVLSGAGQAQRTHILLKPLERGLETNLVLTTSRRVYLIDLASGPVDGFNAAVEWEDATAPAPMPGRVEEPVHVPDPVVTPGGSPEGRYRIEPQGRRPRWTPVSVFNDGRRTFIAFDPDLQAAEAPALFVVAPGGERRLVNYRQADGVFIVDRVLDEAELRLGDRRAEVVRIRRIPGARP